MRSLWQLRWTINNILTESKIDDLQAKYPNLDVEFIAKEDPSPTKKYLPWMMKMLATTGLYNKDRMFRAIFQFDKNLQRIKNKDINSYKNIGDVEYALETLPPVSKSQEKKNLKAAGAEKIYEDETHLIVRPDTKDAVCSYGSGTRWCITQREDTHYEDYVSRNIMFYFIISKTDNTMENRYAKIAVTIYRDDTRIKKIEYYDARDSEMDAHEVEKQIANFRLYMQHIEKNVTKQPTDLLIKLYDRTASAEEIEKLTKTHKNNPKILRFIAANSKTPENVLWQLAHHPDEYVRREVAMQDYGHLSPRISNFLAKDEDQFVRYNVAENEETPEETLMGFIDDPNPTVRAAASKTLERLASK